MLNWNFELFSPLTFCHFLSLLVQLSSYSIFMFENSLDSLLVEVSGVRNSIFHMKGEEVRGLQLQSKGWLHGKISSSLLCRYSIQYFFVRRAFIITKSVPYYMNEESERWCGKFVCLHNQSIRISSSWYKLWSSFIASDVSTMHFFFLKMDQKCTSW